ncbi:hypothetical protein CIG75_04090 [Tumebacillus algifaecis]|uniref:Tyrosine-protein phosphatase domain-containing protein n=1 Tax=Tumebacillus algifaecis TaxID=1214604 RepID=A0A223CYP3_9BACL|nr:dual specificity protein phosphatase [Tumebacillus algifaecis]ASS74243.1 hypothetical protein CIG75_04090 [Tumebacillus algifaecis]
MDYDTIIPGRLYGGGRIDQQGWQKLRTLGVSAILNVRQAEDQIPAGGPIPIAMYWFRLGDKSKPALSELVQAVETVVYWLECGRIVYVHDEEGRNRLGFLLTAILMRLYRLPWQSALSKARERRGVLAPRAQFRELLADYQRYLQIPNG